MRRSYCGEVGCTERHYAQGRCKSHYYEARHKSLFTTTEWPNRSRSGWLPPMSAQVEGQVNWRNRDRYLNEPRYRGLSMLEVAEQDQWRCRLCDKLVSRDDLSIDRIAPGEPYTPVNVQAVHKGCNSARSNRPFVFRLGECLEILGR